MNQQALRYLLDGKTQQYNRPDFIEHDPISIPKAFTKREDIEIAGLFAAVLAWGQRITIINKSRQLMERMDHAPHDFLMQAGDAELRQLVGFKHRTFNDTDLLYFISFLQSIYQKGQSLEDVFVPEEKLKGDTVERAISSFYKCFVTHPDCPPRTRKHVQSPERKSACKRINMYLRWMVRSDDTGVDFGLWKKILPSQLVCPCDLHVDRVARKLGLITRKQTDWLTALELTENLRQLNSEDPVRYDFALFGLGIEEKYGR